MKKNQTIWANYDPDKVKEGLRKIRGALQGVDSDTLHKEIREQRGQDSNGQSASYVPLPFLCSCNPVNPLLACHTKLNRYTEKTLCYNQFVFRKVILSEKE